MADALFWQATQVAADFGVAVPDVGIQNGGGIRNNTLIPAGNITELTTFDIAPFSNFVSVTENLDREAFRQVLERAVSVRPASSGRFAQVSGFTFVYSLSGTVQVLNPDGTILTDGSRVTSIVLDDSTVICCTAGGAVFSGADLTVASIDFLARGGDGYPFFSPFTRVGFSYQQALANYIVNGLGGVISGADYPEGGEGRITELP
jgi:5'-nucleotidase